MQTDTQRRSFACRIKAVPVRGIECAVCEAHFGFEIKRGEVEARSFGTEESMKCRRVALESEVEKYEVGKGMEDGFELWADVVTKEWIVTDMTVKITRDNGMIVCPYVIHRRGRTFLREGDYIITDSDGTKHVCGEDKIFSRYERIE